MSLTVSATPATLTRYLTENPEAVAKFFARKEKLYLVASVISGLAAIVILFSAPLLMGGTYAVLKIASVVLIAGVCLEGFNTFDQWGTVACYRKVLHQLIAHETKQIKQSGESAVQQVFQKAGRTTRQLPAATQEVLAKLNPENRGANRWEALVPLIARYQVGDSHAKAKMVADQQTYKLKPAFLNYYCFVQKKECAAFLGFA
jgi:hypothetical protein